MAEPSDGGASDPSLWDRVPDLVSLEIATWEHAACALGSRGRANRVADLRRLLPDELTKPIYARMAQAEALFLRRTEPIPPLRERLARDFDLRSQASEPGSATVDDTAPYTPDFLDLELRVLLPGTLKLNDVVPGWDAGVADALGANATDIARGIHNFASLGLPRGEFSVTYGYRLFVRRIPGNRLRPALATHRALLMGCDSSAFQPGPLRDLFDAL